LHDLAGAKRVTSVDQGHLRGEIGEKCRLFDGRIATANDCDFLSAEEEAATHSKDPLSGQSAILWVNGLGCPQCATNIDFQLKRIRGVSDVYTDLSDGKVTVALARGTKPSPYRLSEAVKDAGMTLVKIEAK
jgi:copper chaperone CopZ